MPNRGHRLSRRPARRNRLRRTDPRSGPRLTRARTRRVAAFAAFHSATQFEKPAAGVLDAVTTHFFSVSLVRLRDPKRSRLQEGRPGWFSTNFIACTTSNLCWPNTRPAGRERSHEPAGAIRLARPSDRREALPRRPGRHFRAREPGLGRNAPRLHERQRRRSNAQEVQGPSHQDPRRPPPVQAESPTIGPGRGGDRLRFAALRPDQPWSSLAPHQFRSPPAARAAPEPIISALTSWPSTATVWRSSPSASRTGAPAVTLPLL